MALPTVSTLSEGRFSGLEANTESDPYLTLDSLLLATRSGEPRIHLEDDLQPVLVVPLLAHFNEPVLADERQ